MSEKDNLFLKYIILNSSCQHCSSLCMRIMIIPVGENENPLDN